MTMVSRGSQRERDLDLDDWFAETDFAQQDTAHRRSPRPVAREDDTVGLYADEQGADDWLGRADERDDVPFRPSPVDLKNPRLWLALAAVVALVVLALYVGGVFGGSKHPAASPPTTPVVQTPTTGAKTKTTPKTAKKAAHLVLPTQALKSGDSGVQVKRLQQALAAVGYSPGKIDGRYGAATKRALEKFQKAKKLTADGIFGPKTLAALTSAQH
jgi:Putative peptidoglycan binding domain